MRFTDRIPIQLYPGSVVAFGRYGAPTVSLRKVGIAGVLLALLGLVGVLYFVGVLDAATIGGSLLAGGVVVVTPTSAEDIASELSAKRQAFKTWYTAEKEAGTLKADEFQAKNNELNALAESYEEAKGVDDAIAANEAQLTELNTPVGRKVRGGDANPKLSDRLAPEKTLGELFTESKIYKDFVEGGHPKGQVSDAHEVDLDKMYGKGRGFKTLFDLAASFATQSVRLPEVITPNAQQPTIASLMPEGRTSQAAIQYMEETTTTTGAAETAESGSKPEAALAFTERTSTVRKIAVSLPVTDESLEDVPFIESYIDGRLQFFVIAREDSQLLNGNGTPPNLRGLLNISGINTQATGTDKNQDAILKGIVALEVASYFPADAVVLHPTNWQTMVLDKDDVGAYLFGPPSGPGPERVWGYRMLKTTAIAAGTALAGAFRAGAQVFRRSGLSLQVGWVNDQFVKNQRTIVVEERLALVCFRPAAFTKITGLA